MATQLATIEQYFEFRGEKVPEMDDAFALELNSKLMRASNRIRFLLRRARLAWSSTGFPKNATIREEVARATAAQASFMGNTGDIDGSASKSGYDSVSMDGVSYAKRGSTVARDQNDAGSRNSPEVAEILGALPIWSTRVNH